MQVGKCAQTTVSVINILKFDYIVRTCFAIFAYLAYFGGSWQSRG